MDHTDDSFTSAWSKAGFPPENRAFAERVAAEIGVSGYRFRPGSDRYIAAARRDGKGELRIHSGYTAGFTEAEARRLGAGADMVRPSTTQGVTWLVSHPTHGDLSLGGSNDSTVREAQRCRRCGIYELSVSGVCPGCDED